MKILINIIYFLVIFIIVFIIDFLLLSRKKNKSTKTYTYKYTNADNFIIKRNNLDMKKVNLKLLNFYVAIINSLIIAFTATLICSINVGIGLQLLIAFALLFGLIYALYEILGRILKRKWK